MPNLRHHWTGPWNWHHSEAQDAGVGSVPWWGCAMDGASTMCCPPGAHTYPPPQFILSCWSSFWNPWGRTHGHMVRRWAGPSLFPFTWTSWIWETHPGQESWLQAHRLELLGSTAPHVSRTPQHPEVLPDWQDIHLLAASPDDQYRPHGPPGGLSVKHILTFSSRFLLTSTLS